MNDFDYFQVNIRRCRQSIRMVLSRKKKKMCFTDLVHSAGIPVMDVTKED